MVMSTQTLDSASALLSGAVLLDTITIYNAGPTVTTGIQASRELTPVATEVPALVQTTLLANAVESQVTNLYSVKVARGTALLAGQVVEVTSCQEEPTLVGKKLLLDKVSSNGAAIIRKAVASDWSQVDQQGKGSING